MLLLACNAALAAPEGLETLVNRGNAAAEQQDYPAAIHAYEQAMQQAPAEKTLKGNLAVLYANYAVTLQESKKYEEALQALDKGLKLAVPGGRDERTLRESKAGVYYAQAMDLKDSAANPTDADYARMKSWLEKAIALNPTEANLKKGMAHVYLDEAYQLATQERFAEAEPLLQKALAYDPQNKAVKQSLANVYLGLGKSDSARRAEWLDKAVAADESPKIREVAERLRKQGNSGGQAAAGFAPSPGEAKTAAPKELSKLSVADMVRDMEAQLQMTPPSKATLTERVDALEKQVLGKPQTGPLAMRAKTVYTALMGSMDAASLSQSNPQLVQAPALASENNYVANIFKVTDGKVIRWGKFPLRVYFEEPQALSAFKPEYKDAALEGFKTWKAQTQGFVNFVEVKNPQAADIQVAWAQQYVDRFADPEKVPDVYRHYTPPKASPLLRVVQVASMVTPGYFSLAPQAVGAAMQYQQMKKLNVIKDESKITLGLSPTQGLAPEAAKVVIQNMAAREFGHALGLKGSSPQAGDLLFPQLRSDMPQVPSQRDLATLREIYNRPPNIILNVH